MSIVKVFTSRSKNSVIAMSNNLKWYLPLKTRSFRNAVLATYIDHLWQAFLHPLMNRFLNLVNLSLETHVVLTFWLESDTSGTFSLFLAQPSLKIKIPVLKIHILWCRTDICSWKLSKKVSLMLVNPFPVTFLCKLKHISVYFIQNSMKLACK